MADRYIPTDILFNILVRLPATSLQRLKYASKQWFSTISDPDFAEAHFAHQSQEEFGYNVLVSLNKDDIFIGERLTSNPNPPQRMNLPGVHGRVCVYDSCKGLVLFRCGTSLHIANPITGDWLSLPQFYGYGSIFSASIGCVCDSISSANIGCGCDDKLKVVVVGRRSRSILKSALICGVLTPGSRSWRELHIPVVESLLEPSRAGGALHWIYETGLLSLDLGEEKFHQTEVTFCDYSQLRYHSCDLEWDGCFAIFIRQLLTNRYYCGWVLKKSGWMKLPDVDVAFFKHIGLPLIENGPIGHPLMENGPILATSARYGEMILFLQVVGGGMQLFAYDMGRGTVTKFTEFDSNFSLPYLEQGRFAITTHVDSMISCSSFDFPKKGGVCFSVKKFLTCLASTLSHLFQVCFLARFLAYLASTLNNLFKS